jgi:hypothetical protein
MIPGKGVVGVDLVLLDPLNSRISASPSGPGIYFSNYGDDADALSGRFNV